MSERLASYTTTPRFDLLTMPELPIIRAAPQLQKRPARHWYDDVWLVALVLCAICASIAAAVWAYQTQSILLYGDAHSHLLIARRVLDGLQPGLAQLGDVWLPLPHLIMVPLAWNDFLWRSGLAGTLTSMPCYVISAIYVYLTARRLTHSGVASFIGSLVFVLNPNILYLQSTPLSEPVLFATLTAASYYFIAWAQNDELKDLIFSALATLLATLSRYDGWALYLALIAGILVINWRNRQPVAKAISDSVLFVTLGGIGIALWFVWNLVIFGSPMAFLAGSYSSQAQTQAYIRAGVADTYHNVWLSIRTYSVATAESIGPVIFVLLLIAVLVYLVRTRLSAMGIAACTVLVPFAFYALAFYLGQDVMYVPHATHLPFVYYNARFGAEMAAPAAVFLATLVATFGQWVRLSQIAIAAVIIAQTAFISWGGIITLQDGAFGASCYSAHPIAAFLAQHYDGGRVLIDQYHSQIDISSAGVAFHDEIYEGDGAAWNDALAHPASYVNWVIVTPNDLISQHINLQSPGFLQQFALVSVDSPTGAKLWHRISAPTMPSRPLPNDVIAPYVACNRAKGLPLADANRRLPGNHAQVGQIGARALASDQDLQKNRDRV